MQTPIKIAIVFVAFWAICALITLSAANQPGLAVPIDGWVYPWGGVFVVWAQIAVMLAGLYLVLWPKSMSYIMRRLKWGVTYSAIFAVLGVLLNVTDMPGHHYVPIYSSWAMFTGILIGAGLAKEMTDEPN